MQLKNIKLPFTQEEYAAATSAMTPLEIQTALSRIALLPEPMRGDLLLALTLGLYLGTPEKHGTATISRVKSGPNKGQYKVKFQADNRTNLSPQDTLHNEQDLRDTLEKYFSTFEVIEK